MKKPYSLYNNSSVLLRDVSVPELPSEIEIEDHRLYIKDEFHITLLGARFLADFMDPSRVAALTSQMLKEFDKFIKTNPLDNYKISKEFRYVQENEQKTIIAITEVQNLDKLFDHLSKKFSLDFPRQVPHVTLYRSPKGFIGIPIPSYEKLENISKPITVPALQSFYND